MAKIILERKEGDYGFKVEDEKGHILQTDSSIENGGVDFGFRPMQLLLASLGSCSAIDMISILKKQKQVIKNFKIEIVGERETDVVLALWKNVSVSFYLNGNIET
ncbi:MAG: OsmC family protein, partial [Segetibacter sp.]